MKRFTVVLCLVVCSLFLPWPVLAVPISFDFTASEIVNGSYPELNFQALGLNLQVTAAEDPTQTSLLVHKYTGGLGVDSGIGSTSDNSKMIDNSGPDELLQFHFSREVRLLQVAFSYVDSGDSYRLFVDGGLLLSEMIPAEIVDYAVTGSLFAFGATDSSHTYRIRQMTVDDLSAATAPVPEPATWALLLVGLVAMAGWSRLRQGR